MSFPEFGKIIEKAPESKESFPEFGEVIQSSQQKEKYPLRRHALRTGTVAATSIAGIPGQARELVENIPKGIAKISGVKPEKIEQIAKPTKTALSFFFPQVTNLPSSEQIRKPLHGITKGYLKPRSSKEEFSDEVVDFTAPLLVPLKGINTLDKGKKIINTALKGLGATYLGEKVREHTGSEVAGKGTQLGSYVLMSLVNPKGMTKYINNLYSEMDKTIGESAPLLKTDSYLNNLTKLEREINQSLSPSEAQKKILNKIDEIKSKITPETAAKNILETKKSINDDLRSLMMQSDKPTRTQIKRYMKRLTGITKESLKEYGEKNPEFWEKLQAADEASGTRAESEWISRSIEKAFEGKSFPILSKTLPGLFLGAGHLLPGVGALKGGLATPAYYLSRFMYRYAKSPELRKYYNNLITGGIRQDKRLVQKSAENIEKELGK